jgi:hypothetical protein
MPEEECLGSAGNQQRRGGSGGKGDRSKNHFLVSDASPGSTIGKRGDHAFGAKGDFLRIVPNAGNCGTLRLPSFWPNLDV